MIKKIINEFETTFEVRNGFFQGFFLGLIKCQYEMKVLKLFIIMYLLSCPRTKGTND